MSYSASVIQTRKYLLEIFLRYLEVSRGIDDLKKEDDYAELKSAIDTALEDSVAQFKSN